MRRNPFKKLLPKNPVRQAADDFLESVREAERMIAGRHDAGAADTS